MAETNIIKTIGIRPANPEQAIPVKQTAPLDLNALVNIRGYDLSGGVWRDILVDTTGKLKT